jgi:mono/diheme cytochrome c family protein
MSGVRLLALMLCTLLPSFADAADELGLAQQAQTLLKQRCSKCHDGPNARADVQILQTRKLIQSGVVLPGKPNESELLELVECGTMPPGRVEKLTAEETRILRQWIIGGAPAFQGTPPADPVLLAIAQDVSKLDKDMLRFQRYISFYHLSKKKGVTATACRDALTRGLNLLSRRKEPVLPKDVEIEDGTGMVFRIDLRDLGWDEEAYKTSNKDGEDGFPTLNLFDLVLLEYPAPALPDLSSGSLHALSDFLNESRPVLPVVYIRGDWLLDVALRPPLYDDLLQLPRTLGNLYEQLGVDSAKTVRAGIPRSESAPGIRLVVRRPIREGGFFWQTYDPPPTKSQSDLLASARTGVEADSQVIFSLPNGLPGFYASQRYEGGRRWSVALNQSKHILYGQSCAECHRRGPEVFQDAVRPMLEDSPLPEFTKKELRLNYGGQRPLQPLLEEDQKTVQEALERVHQNHVPNADPIKRLLENYSGPPSGGLVPLDGLLLGRWEPPAGPLGLAITALNHKTGKETTTFQPGDEMTLRVRNNGDRAVYFELVLIASDGYAAVTQPVRKLNPNETYNHPKDRLEKPKEFLTINQQLGTDSYILYASFSKFPGGTVLESKGRIRCGSNRVLHRWYDWPAKGSATPDLTRIVKKTVSVLAVEKQTLEVKTQPDQNK